MLTKTLKVPSQAKAEERLKLRYLEPDEYPLWDALVDLSPQGSVFCRSWWLRAVGNVRILACFSGNQIVAGVPLYFERHFGIPVCTMPKLTQTWGVVLSPPEGKPVTALSREIKILRAFATELSRHKLFFQAFHPSLSNWLPFYWSGFRQTTRFTYVIDDLSDLGRVWREMSEHARSQIKKAQRAGFTLAPCSIEEVFRCECLSYQRHGMTTPHNESLLKDIYHAAKENDSGACFAIVGRDGILYSAWFLVWDRKLTHGVVRGADSAMINSAANSLGVWGAFQFAAQRSRGFDFAGSVVEGIERFNRTFGARQVPYNFVIKAPTLVQSCLQFAGKL